jgi:hypothetical protein
MTLASQTNPGPLEDILCDDPRIKGAIMFGRGRFQNGVIIQPGIGHAVDFKDQAALVG